MSLPREPSTRIARRTPAAYSCESTWPITGWPARFMSTFGDCAVSRTLGREATERTAVSTVAAAISARHGSNATDSELSATRPLACSTLSSPTSEPVRSLTEQPTSLASRGRSMAVTAVGVLPSNPAAACRLLKKSGGVECGPPDGPAADMASDFGHANRCTRSDFSLHRLSPASTVCTQDFGE